MWKNTIEIPVPLFFHNILGPNLGNILPQRPHPLSFFINFQWNMLKGSININNLCWNPAASSKKKKKMAKPLKIAFFGPICTKKGLLWVTSKMQNNKRRNNKRRSSGFRNFLFSQNIICFSWVMNLFLSWVMFFVKKVSFSKKQLWMLLVRPFSFGYVVN